MGPASVRRMRHLLLGALLGLAVSTSLAAGPLTAGIERADMDPSVRPQDDLYLAVNGTWLKTAEIPADKSNYGSFIALDDLSSARIAALVKDIAGKTHPEGSNARKIADLYTSFMAEDVVEKLGATPVKDALAELSLIRTHDEVARQFARNETLGLASPLSFGVEVDARNSGQYITALDQSGLTMPDRDYYIVDEDRYREARVSLLSYIESLFLLAGDEPGQAAEAARRILDIETGIARAQWTRVDLRDPEKNYNKTAVSELPVLAPGFSWTTYLSELGVTVEEINVSQPTYVQAIAQLFTEVPAREWSDYLRFRLLDGVAPYLSRAFQEAHFNLHGKALAGIPQQKSREQRAIDTISGAGPGDAGVLGEAVGQLYVEAHFPAEAKTRMDALVRNLLEAYRLSINELSWMTPATKAKAQEKLSKYTVKIGYPEVWRDYTSLQITPDDLVGNIRAAKAFDHRRALDRLGKPVDRKEWWMTPQTVNAYYSPSKNEIVFPAAILQPPFFNVQADDAVNYGGIGAVIGHEISHGFDDKGSRYDGDGNLQNWWSPEDRAAFETLTAKLVAQYAAYEPLPGRALNGQLTLGENIADLSGLAIAYKAYRLSLGGAEAPVLDGLTGDQRFFMGWAQVWKRKYREAELARRLLVDPHAPSHNRANGAPINSDAFHQAFQTKPGDGLYKAPEDRIRIW